MTETELIDQYICQHIEPEGDYLYRLYRATNIHTIHGRMASGHIQGRLLKMLVQMIRPKNILEVGTFSGYSAICLAQGLQEGGKLYTFEINDEMEDFTRPWIEGSDVADKIDFRIGDANEEAPKLGVMFDLAFVDGDKRTYIETYEMVMKILNPVCAVLRREREEEIKRLAEHEEQYRNELTSYENSQVNVEVMLRRAQSYKELYLYKWLRDDVREFMKEK
jgi:predicted O-methyltransferase YrrM